MKISIIEANMTEYQHSYPNSVYINILADIFGHNNIEVYCSEEHFKCMGFTKCIKAVRYIPIKVIPGNNNMIKKFIYEFYNTFKIIKSCRSDLIIFLSSCPDIQLPLISYMRRKKQPNIIIMTHGELEGLLMGGKWKIWSYPFWIDRCFKKRLPQNVFRIVLGKSISQYLKKVYKEPNIFYIDQPRDDFKEKNEVVPCTYKNIYGFIGDFLIKKGGNTFKKIANEVEKSSSEFWLIGAHHENIGNDIKTFSKMNEYLNKNYFDSLIEKITYACFPYPCDSYKLTASGAVLDAIRHLKPIIYIGNDYFDGIFEFSGDIGYRCRNEKEFCDTIHFLEQHVDIARYRFQVENLKVLQNKFQKDAVAAQLENIIDRILN